MASVMDRLRDDGDGVEVEVLAVAVEEEGGT
jgi:hypothetical protein